MLEEEMGCVCVCVRGEGSIDRCGQGPGSRATHRVPHPPRRRSVFSASSPWLRASPPSLWRRPTGRYVGLSYLAAILCFLVRRLPIAVHYPNQHTESGNEAQMARVLPQRLTGSLLSCSVRQCGCGHRSPLHRVGACPPPFAAPFPRPPFLLVGLGDDVEF